MVMHADGDHNRERGQLFSEKIILVLFVGILDLDIQHGNNFFSWAGGIHAPELATYVK